MPTYPINQLGPTEFEHLTQALLKETIGKGTITFGPGRDGAREATFSGSAPYPSTTEHWEGEWIFQAKFHDVDLIGVDAARKLVLSELDNELDKVVNKYKHPCDNYILVTNVPFSSVAERGTHDRIYKEIAPKYRSHITNIQVWAYDDICRLLDAHPNVRLSYIQFLTTGDIISKLLLHHNLDHDSFAETIRLYLSSSLHQEQYAQLLQAGDAGDDRIPLQQVFIDLDVTRINRKRLGSIQRYTPGDTRQFRRPDPNRFSALGHILNDSHSTVIIGGPGQGKSTVTQCVAQIHRATLLNSWTRMYGDQPNMLPKTPRVPFRILLKDYAQWMSNTDTSSDHLEAYIAERIKERTGRECTVTQLHGLFKSDPILFILDGLDEVMDTELQARMLNRIENLIGHCESILAANVQVLATSRPNIYKNQFDPDRFTHLELAHLTRDQVDDYVKRWAAANSLENERRRFLENTLREYISDQHLALLMNTPLQVTILILIILSGGAPPQQREALFNEYLEIVYKRERSKAKWVITTAKDLLFGLHQYIGYLIYSRAESEHGSRDVLDEQEFVAAIRTFLKYNDSTLVGKHLDEQVNRIIQEARDRLVLIVEPMPQMFGYELRSLLEFCTAAFLVDTAANSAQRLDRFKAIALRDYWKNVALFFAGRLARTSRGEAAGLLEVCREIDREGPDEILGRGLYLALDMAVDLTFGSNKNLHRSTIEYALSLFGRRNHIHKIGALRDGLRKLTIEDISTVVLPDLERQIKQSNRGHKKAILEVYTQFSQSNNFTLGALEEFLSSSSPADVSWGLRQSFDLGLPAQWLAERLDAARKALEGATFADIVGEAMVTSAPLAKMALDQCDISDADLVSILDHVMHKSPGQLPETDPDPHSEWRVPHVADTHAQVWLSLRLLHLLHRQLENNEHSDNVEIFSGAGVRISFEPTASQNCANTLIDSTIGLDTLSLAATTEGLLPLLRTCCWSLLVLVRRHDIDGLREFVSYLESEIDNSSIVFTFLKSWLRHNDMSLSLLVHGIEDRAKDMDKLVDQVANAPDVEARLFDSLQQWRQSARGHKEDEKQEIPLELVRHSLSDPPESLSALGKSAITVVGLLDKALGFSGVVQHCDSATELFLIATGFELPKLMSEDVRSAAETITSMLDDPRHIDDALRKLSLLVKCDWEQNADNLSVVLSCIQIFHEKCPEPMTIDLVALESILCVKLSFSSPKHDEELLELLARIGSHIDNRGTISRCMNSLSIDRNHRDLAPRLLAQFLTGTTSRVKKGAIMLIQNTLNTSTRYYIDEYAYSLRRTPTTSQYWSVELVRDMLRNDLLSRTALISMLTFAEFQTPEDMEWVLNEIRASSGGEEAYRWSDFIEAVGIIGSQQENEMWFSALETILMESNSFRSTVVNSTLRRFDSLVRMSSKQLVDIESDLGLPLAT